jgi:hypothetical protein
VIHSYDKPCYIALPNYRSHDHVSVYDLVRTVGLFLLTKNILLPALRDIIRSKRCWPSGKGSPWGELISKNHHITGQSLKNNHFFLKSQISTRIASVACNVHWCFSLGELTTFLTSGTHCHNWGGMTYLQGFFVNLIFQFLFFTLFYFFLLPRIGRISFVTWTVAVLPGPWMVAVLPASSSGTPWPPRSAYPRWGGVSLPPPPAHGAAPCIVPRRPRRRPVSRRGTALPAEMQGTAVSPRLTRTSSL